MAWRHPRGESVPEVLARSRERAEGRPRYESAPLTEQGEWADGCESSLGVERAGTG